MYTVKNTRNRSGTSNSVGSYNSTNSGITNASNPQNQNILNAANQGYFNQPRKNAFGEEINTNIISVNQPNLILEENVKGSLPNTSKKSGIVNQIKGYFGNSTSENYMKSIEKFKPQESQQQPEKKKGLLKRFFGKGGKRKTKKSKKSKRKTRRQKH